MSDDLKIEPFSPADLAKRRKRSIAMAIGLAALVVLFFVTTLVRLGSSIADRAV